MAVIGEIVKGYAAPSVTVKIIGAADGIPDQSLAYNTSGLALWYRRQGGAKVALTLADLTTPALTDAWEDSGFLHIDDGDYRLDLPAAAAASGAEWVDVGGTGTDLIVLGGRIELVAAKQTGDSYAYLGTNLGAAGANATEAGGNGDHLTQVGLVDGAITAAKIASDAIQTAKIQDGAFTAAKFAAGAFDAVWSVTTRTLTAISDSAGITTLLGRLSAARAGYLDWLNVGGLVSTAADIAAITVSSRVRIVIPSQLERPDDATPVDYRLWIYHYGDTGLAEDLDSVPTVTAENNAGTDRSSNLGTVTKLPATTGVYYVDYTVAQGHAIEGLVFKVTATEDAVATVYPASSHVVDTTAVDFTAADRTKLEAIHGKLPSKDYLRGTADADGGLDTEDKADINEAADTALTDYDAYTGTPPTTDEIRDAILDRGLAGNHDTAGTPGKLLQDAATEATSLAVKSKTDNLPAEPAAKADIPTAAQNRTEMDSNSTKLAAIETEVNKIPRVGQQHVYTLDTSSTGVDTVTITDP